MDQNTESLKLVNQLCFPLYAASREIVKQYTPYLDKIGLTYTQYIVMLVLWEQKQIGVKALGKLLYLDSGTLTPVLKKLEQAGLAVRRRGIEDERTVTVSLTEAGEALKEKAAGIPPEIAKCVHLTPEESITLYKLLYKILEEFK